MAWGDGLGPVQVITADSTAYPERLRDLEVPPDPLYVLGSLDVLTGPTVTIVGTRNATPYGERITRALAESLGRAGACVVSGMARGVDAVAHRAALAVGARTAAVLGTGVDVPYPVGHRELQAEIATRGTVLSEYPPGAHAWKGTFLKRNRILAALSELTIVVEAGERSGALSTAEWAASLDRTIACVPGPIDSPQSEGTNRLLRNTTAQIITSVEDVLALMKLAPPARSSHPTFGASEHCILAELRRSPGDLDSLTARTGLPARECIRAVTTLELAGAIECSLTGEIRRR